MQPAIIKICKKVLLDRSIHSYNNSINQFLNDHHRELWNNCMPLNTYNSWEDFKSRNDSRTINGRNQEANRVITNPLNTFKDFLILYDTFSIDKILLTNPLPIIIESDPSNSDSHKVELFLFSDEITLIDSFSNKILVANGNHSQNLLDKELIDNTFLILMTEELSICSYTAI